jgi:hypothetical protein
VTRLPRIAWKQVVAEESVDNEESVQLIDE